MGRSRGGLTTKIHAVVDANGNPITLKLSEGQAHHGRSAVDLLDTVQTVARQSGSELRDNQREKLRMRRGDDCRGATSWQVIS
jgi:transposase